MYYITAWGRDFDYRRWLDPASPEIGTILRILKSFPNEYLTVYPVYSIVNNPANDILECLPPVSVPET